ncbi:MAG TPA: 30S ribosome-binding factor RbfA [Firmicutes bacterium]|nr:30S ribosome-binding factor RbfA [Bacillota bacterium]
MAQRRDRIGASIREVVSDLMLRRLKDPRIGFASIVNVDVNKDLSLAKVYVSVLGSNEEKEKTMEGLKSAQGLIRSEVSKALGIRYAPEIQFVLDEGIEYSMRVSQLLSELKKDEKQIDNE